MTKCEVFESRNKKCQLLYSHDVRVHSIDGRRPGILLMHHTHCIIDSQAAKCGHAAKTLAVGERHYDFITGEFTGNWIMCGAQLQFLELKSCVNASFRERWQKTTPIIYNKVYIALARRTPIGVYS